MIFCGIKITHDGGIALIENGVLKLSIEMEKIANNSRYSSLKDLDQIQAILYDYGYTLDQIDHFVIDGWHGADAFWR
ncbi:MAG: carbamoyltransferase N-terminal domain-containing protein, partial [Bacteroidota bacterium]